MPSLRAARLRLPGVRWQHPETFLCLTSGWLHKKLIKDLFIFLGSTMNSEHPLAVDCAELRELAEANPEEMAIIVEMMIEAEEELCLEEAA